MSDKYDEAVAYLTEHPEEISQAWFLPYTVKFGDTAGRPREAHRAGCLFQGACRTQEEFFCELGGIDDDSNKCGCLTQIKSGDRRAATPELTQAIRADTRLPRLSDTIEVRHLPVFAEWQRKLDEVLNRG